MRLAAALWKDARREARGKEALQAALVLVVLFGLIHLFAFPDLRGQVRAAAAVIWSPIVFAAAALSGRHLANEADTGTLDWLRAAPVDAVWHGVSRTLVDGVVLTTVAAFALLVDAILFGVPLDGWLWLVVGLGAVGLAIVGAIAGGLAAQARAREVLLPILLVPVTAPLLLAGVTATITVLADGGAGALRTPLLLMAGFDVAAAGIAWLLWPVVLEAE
jgi:ABC-type transport system involved in cytochrome c biogenesis permease component